MNVRGGSDELTDLLVVGASFAGVACAIEAARAGLSVVLIERKHDAGEKLHTTGIVVKEAADELGLLGDLPPELIRPIGGVRLYGSRLNGVALDLPGYFFLATDTPILMRWLISQASDAGVDVRLGTRAFVVIGVEGSAAALATRLSRIVSRTAFLWPGLGGNRIALR